MTTEHDLQKEMVEHAWRYFSLHAGQRMSLFGFFTVLSTSVAAGSAIAGSKDARSMQMAGAALGLLLVIVAFVFAKLDRRVCTFLRRSERALAQLEQLRFPAHSAQLFSLEPELTAVEKTSRSPIFSGWTYGTAFRFVFWTMGIVGAVETAFCLIRAADASPTHLLDCDQAGPP